MLLSDLSIAIVTKNRRTSLLRLLDSLAKQKNITEVGQIHIFENQLRSITQKDKCLYKKKLPNVVFSFSLSHKVESRNNAIQSCKTRFLVFLDDDVTVSDNWLKVIRTILQKYGKSGKLFSFYQGSYQERFANESVRVKEEIRYYEYFFRDSIEFTNSSLLKFSLDTKNVLLDVSFLKENNINFDPIFNRYGFCEDTDLGYTIYKNGGCGKYLSDLKVVHYKPMTWFHLILLYSLSGKAYGLFCRKHHLPCKVMGEIKHTINIFRYLKKNSHNKYQAIQFIGLAGIYRFVFSLNFYNQCFLK